MITGFTSTPPTSIGRRTDGPRDRPGPAGLRLAGPLLPEPRQRARGGGLHRDAGVPARRAHVRKQAGGALRGAGAALSPRGIPVLRPDVGPADEPAARGPLSPGEGPRLP